ncbi:MAG: tetratricopeptide repeat protein [Thermoanaerobaculia bacterium]
MEPENAATGLKSLFFTYEATLRFATLVLLSEFLRSDVQSPSIAQAVRRLRIPHLNDWFTVLCSVAKVLGPVVSPTSVNRGFAGEASVPFSIELVLAARAFRGLKEGQETVHETLRDCRNEQDGHSAIWTEVECRRHLDRHIPLLERVVAHCEYLATLQVLRLSPGGYIQLEGASETFIEMPLEDPLTSQAFSESDVILRNASGALLPLYPLFSGAEGPPDGFREPLLSFYGHGRERLVYLGVRSRVLSARANDRYSELLRQKAIDPRFTKAEMKPWIVADWARETSLGVLEGLRNVKFFPAFYQERCEKPLTEGGGSTQGVDDVVLGWLDRGPEPALIVAAEAGAGKTSLLCHLAERLVGSDMPENRSHLDCVLLVLGGEVRGDQGLFGRIRDGLGFVDSAGGGIRSFAELLNAWVESGKDDDDDFQQRRLILLIDAVNEAERPKDLLEEVANLAASAAAAGKKAGWPFTRLLVTIRSGRIQSLLDRWSREHDTPFLAHPEHFAFFRDGKGQAQPYLSLRPFTFDEVGRAYESARTSLKHPCPARWESLAATTIRLLETPLMVLLFHEAFAGVEMPPSVGSEDVIWSTWLERSFDPRQGRQHLEKFTLDLADICIDRGTLQIPQDVAAEWREQWEESLGNDPVRLAASLDPLERLMEAGLLRRAGVNALDWVSDSLAERLFARALRRRSPSLSKEDLRVWLALVPTPRLDGALVEIAAELWRAGMPESLVVLLTPPRSRGQKLLGRTISRLAPRGEASRVSDELEIFESGLRRVLNLVVESLTSEKIDTFKDALLWDCYVSLADRLGTTAALHAVVTSALSVAERLVTLEPENTMYLRDLSVSYNYLGGLDERLDAGKAREWFGKGLKIANRVLQLCPDDAALLRNKTICLVNLGSILDKLEDSRALSCFSEAVILRRELIRRDPGKGDLWVSLANACHKMGAWLTRHGRPEEDGPLLSECLDALKRAEDLSPSQSRIPRILAGAMAVRGRADEALDALEKAVTLGEKDYDEILEDRDLESILYHPRFKKLIETMREV